MKTYVQQQEVNANIDDTYNAMVADRDEVSKKIRAENNRLTNVIITLQVTLVVFVAALLVTVLLLRRYYTNVLPQRRCNETKINNIKQQSTIISISIVSFHLLIYILALDGVALYNRENPPDQEINAIYQNEEPGDPFSILYNLPLIVMTFDIIAALFSFLMLVTAILHRSVRIFKPEKKKLSKRWVLFLRLSSVGPVLSFLMHAPFVTNAYLNDAFHASSIFIYYSVSIFVGFLLLKQVAIYTCLSSVWYAKREKTIHMDNTKVILSCGELNFKKNGSGFVQSVQIAGGNLTLNCNEAKLVRKSLILVNDNHIKVREGQLTLSINNKLKTNLVNTDSDEELHIEGGSLQVQQMWGHDDEEAATDVESYGTKVKLGKGGTLKVHVAYNEINGQHCFVVKGGELVGKDLRCMCFTKWLNTVSGAAICFILTTIVMALLFLSLLAILACYFVLIPINMSISNAGNRLIGVYQSFFVIVGALFAYKTLFKSEQSKSESNPIEQAVKRRKMPFTENAQGAEWGSLPDKEKVDEFYRVVVDIVAQHYTKLHGQ